MEIGTKTVKCVKNMNVADANCIYCVSGSFLSFTSFSSYFGEKLKCNPDHRYQKKLFRLSKA